MRLRESKGISLEQIAQRTKISMTHLRAIEANQYDKLPARVYVRGFVSQYAKYLNIPADRVCDSYLQIYDRFVQSKAQ
jgi:flagellar biosynthesis protein FlhG